MDDINNITKMYENMTYFDQYGSSLLLFILITIMILLFMSYCFVMINMQPIKDDWKNQRCNPYVIPFAGFINKPDDKSVNEFTQENFAYCTQNILKDTTGQAVSPLTYVIKSLSNVTTNIKDSLNDTRGMFDKVRGFLQNVTEEIMGRLLNIIAPIQQIILSFRDTIGKIQGVMTASLMTLIGSYYTLQSLMGAIAQFIVTILIALAALVAGFWAFPFTWGAAIANTAIFLSISIPFAVILAFMSKTMGIRASRGIPKLKCFDKDTIIVMQDGTKKEISNIKLGDILSDGGKVTAKMIVESEGSQMYKLNNVIVSDSHLVLFDNQWIRVSQHPDAIKTTEYKLPHIHCLNTTTKVIHINNMIFSDWDELIEDDIETIKFAHLYNKYNTNHNEKREFDTSMIHKYFDGGFDPNTIVKLEDGTPLPIRSIFVGDVLERREKVYGIVEICGDDLEKQFDFYLNKEDIRFTGGPNLNICERTIPFTSVIHLANDNQNKNSISNNLIIKESRIVTNNKLYHLLTDKQSFCANGICFYDYNASIDLILDKNKGKLLSMKYV
jgi:hypothetical protein